jgi:excinuclease UvrABC ATPase subunit
MTLAWNIDAGSLSSTLSGRKAQRFQLATAGSRLVGACYVLDEPSIGLHSRDTGRLIKILHECAIGQTHRGGRTLIPR